MVRDRNATRFVRRQKDANLPPTRQLEDGLCRLLVPDVDTLIEIARDKEARLRCPGDECAVRAFFRECRKPVEIEVGSGMGRFLVARAKNNPDTHYLGVELEFPRVAKTDVAARAAGLENLSLLCVQATSLFRYCIPGESVTAVYLLFPDPWPKARHHKNRIFQKPFVDMVHRVLKPGGCLHAATDDVPYFTQMNETMEGDTRFAPAEPFKRAEDELTDFELKFMAVGKPVNAASWCKK